MLNLPLLPVVSLFGNDFVTHVKALIFNKSEYV